MKEYIQEMLRKGLEDKKTVKESEFSFNKYKDIAPLQHEIERSLDILSNGDDCISKNSILHLVTKYMEGAYDLGRQHGIVRK